MPARRVTIRRSVILRGNGLVVSRSIRARSSRSRDLAIVWTARLLADSIAREAKDSEVFKICGFVNEVCRLKS